jgi:toxin HigB-1
MAIQSFKCADTEELYRTGKNKRFAGIASGALRKLDMLNAAIVLDDLRAPPGNHLEALRADRRGQHSIRVNQRWRLCFVWTETGPIAVEIVDYH